MLISILINNYNYGEYLKDCIDSCLNQTYIDKEIIVVDDGSIDNSCEIMRIYGSRIKCIYKSNGGQASAFNAGFFASTGDVILFLDSDDMLMPNCLDRISQEWSRSYSKLHFNLIMIGKDFDPPGELFCKGPLPYGDLREIVLKEGNHVSMPTSGNAFSRSFLDKIMPMPEPDWRGNADAYVTNLAPLAGHVGVINEALGFYRRHDKSMAAAVRGSRFRLETLYSSISREIKTDKTIDKFAKEHGLQYNTGALTNSYAHLQQVMVYDKLAPLFFKLRFRSPARDYINLSIAMFRLKSIRLYKIILVHAWMFLLLVAPSTIAVKVVVVGYKRGAMLVARRRKR